MSSYEGWIAKIHHPWSRQLAERIMSNMNCNDERAPGYDGPQPIQASGYVLEIIQVIGAWRLRHNR